jgi:BTB/POZ domain
MLADNPSTNPIIMIRDANAEDIEGILKFIYAGQVHIQQENLDHFIRVSML